MKKLIVYFSATGVTKGIAQRIAGIDGDDIYEIVPEVKYTSGDLNWNDSSSRTTKEKNDKSIRPKILGSVNVSCYDTIILGFPVWWYTAPSIIRTFLDENDLSGKTVIPFATSGGSSINSSEDDLKREYPNINWMKGRRLTGREVDDELRELIN